VPTYDYQCRDCGTTFEVIHPMQEDGPSACERCGGELRRVLFPSGIIFKGSGFYKTDSRSASSGSGSSKAKPASSTTGADGGSKGSGGSGGSSGSGSGSQPSSPPPSSGSD
jgi:putative FmdB family regulatory protein